MAANDPSESEKRERAASRFEPIVAIVDFHHARGPEVETWIGVEEGAPDPAVENDWSLLPFMALSDGAHAAAEDFSYFTLRLIADGKQASEGISAADPSKCDVGSKVDGTETHEEAEAKATSGAPKPPLLGSSLFGVSCTRQLDASTLINRPPEVTRSSVQKAVVVIADSPQHFGPLREKLSVVTRAWFAQRDFTDLQIIRDFQESLKITLQGHGESRDQYFGMSLRQFISDYRHQMLTLFKCCLLQPKMLFFGSNCEKLCMIQFALVSLIPNLIRNLQDCADPNFNTYENSVKKPTTLRTSERSSLLAYMGLPLQIFGEGSLFGPYTPLQQLDLLADHGTKSYIVGSTNSLLLQQKDRYSDILINLDERSITISSISLRNAVALTTPDRRWIDLIVQTVVDTWDEENPSRPNTMGYAGSEEFIRLQFEEYILALLSSVKHRTFIENNKEAAKALLETAEGDPSLEFGKEWIEAWMRTGNFKTFDKHTDSHLFDIVEPLHPCSGGLTIDDVQRRLAQQVSDLHLDTRFRDSRDVVGAHLAVGQKKVSTAFNKLLADIEEMRETQRRKAAEAAAANPEDRPATPAASDTSARLQAGRQVAAQNVAAAQVAASAAGARAGAYLSSWGSWASEKRKAGWGKGILSSASSSTPPSPPSPIATLPTPDFMKTSAPAVTSKPASVTPAPTPTPAPTSAAPAPSQSAPATDSGTSVPTASEKPVPLESQSNSTVDQSKGKDEGSGGGEAEKIPSEIPATVPRTRGTTTVFDASAAAADDAQ